MDLRTQTSTMAKSRSCFDSLRSYLARRHCTMHKNDPNGGVEREGNDCSQKGKSIGERTFSCASDIENDDSAVHYFNNASQSPLSAEVKKLGIELIETSPWNKTDNRHSAQSSQARVRSLFATLADCEDFEEGENFEGDNTGRRIAIFPSTAFAITLAARNIAEQQKRRVDGSGGGRILVLQDQFDSAIYPWQQICDESKGQLSLEIVGHPDEGYCTCGEGISTNANRGRSDKGNSLDATGGSIGWTQAILEKLNGDHNSNEVVAACLPPLHWSDGTLIDLVTIGAACRDRNIPLIVDATQAVGIMPCSVRKIRPTMLACSTHKWLRGPLGCCLAYISAEVQENWIPLDFHGRGRDFDAGSTTWNVSRNEMGPKGYPETYYGDARKFDSGGAANPLLLPMLQKAMEEISTIDTAKAQSQLKVLMQPLLDWAVANGYSIKSGPRAYHLIGIVPREKTPEEMIEFAKILAAEKGVIIAVRCGGFRISPYLTNNPNDVRKLIEGLKGFC